MAYTSRADRLAYAREWNKNNRAKKNAWNQDHAEQIKARGIVYRDAHRAERAIYERGIRDKRRAYARAHPEWADRWHTRRARERKCGGSHTLAEWREKVALFGGCCAYCGEARPLEREHKIPLVRGGGNDIANIVPACRSCNCRKALRTAQEFLAA